MSNKPTNFPSLPKVSAIFSIGLAFGCGGFGYWLGRGELRNKVHLMSTYGWDSETEHRKLSTPVPISTSNIKDSPITQAGIQKSTHEIQIELAQAAMGGSRAAQSQRLVQVLDQMTPENAQALVTELGRLQNAGVSLSSAVWDKAWSRWGEIDAAGALSHFTAYPSGKGTSDVRTVVEGALKTNPNGLRKWLIDSQGSSSGSLAWMETFAMLHVHTAPLDPTAAVTSVLAATDDPILSERCLSCLYDKTISSNGVNGIKSLYAALPLNIKKSVISQIASKLDILEQGKGFEFLKTEAAQSLPPPESLRDLSRRWAKDRGNEVCDWAVTLPDEEASHHFKTTLTTQIMDVWIARRPTEAISWLESHSELSWVTQISKAAYERFNLATPNGLKDELHRLKALAEKEK